MSLPTDLVDTSMAPAVSGGKSGAVALSDLYSLDLKTIYNKTIFQFLVQWGMYSFDIDQMIYTGAESDVMLAAKGVAVTQLTDVAGAFLRQQFPGLVM
jgi:hypothetical protein